VIQSLISLEMKVGRLRRRAEHPSGTAEELETIQRHLREEVLISIVRVTAGIAAHGSSNQSCPGAVPVKDRAPCRAGC